MIGFYSGSSPFEVGFARLPIGPEGRKSMFNGLADSIWVGTRHPGESWQLLRHLASPACQRIVGAAGVVFPAVPDAVDIAMNVYAERGLDVSAFTEQALEEGGTFLFPITDFGSEITSIMDNAITSIFLGQQSAAASLTRANAEVNALFR
jgi:multiple sugar transport system substrate-binding protein